MNGKQYFKAIIRVVKSLTVTKDELGYSDAFGPVEVIREPIIEAADKAEVKAYLVEKYPQFFPTAKVYEKETKDSAQFFYVVIYPLYEFEKKQIEEGRWICAYCGQVHANKYVSKPRLNTKLFGASLMFCSSADDVCMEGYKKEKYRNVDFPDDENYIKTGDPTYIYKCTEKATGKSYIGKTRNAPFFRWWNHLQHSSSPFGIYLRSTKLSDWTFEVLDLLPAETPEPEVFKVESHYILQYDSIKNGFNTVISDKSVIEQSSQSAQGALFV